MGFVYCTISVGDCSIHRVERTRRFLLDSRFSGWGAPISSSERQPQKEKQVSSCRCVLRASITVFFEGLCWTVAVERMDNVTGVVLRFVARLGEQAHRPLEGLHMCAGVLRSLVSRAWHIRLLCWTVDEACGGHCGKRCFFFCLFTRLGTVARPASFFFRFKNEPTPL